MLKRKKMNRGLLLYRRAKYEITASLCSDFNFELDTLRTVESGEVVFLVDSS
jgi:hypothetical protein